MPKHSADAREVRGIGVAVLRRESGLRRAVTLLITIDPPLTTTLLQGRIITVDPDVPVGVLASLVLRHTTTLEGDLEGAVQGSRGEKFAEVVCRLRLVDVELCMAALASKEKEFMRNVSKESGVASRK